MTDLERKAIKHCIKVLKGISSADIYSEIHKTSVGRLQEIAQEAKNIIMNEVSDVLQKQLVAPKEEVIEWLEEIIK